MTEWQPISTASGNLDCGDSALVFAHEVMVTALYLGHLWMYHGEKINPSHWMPLPEPPVT